MPAQREVLAVDIGGTKLAVALVTEDGTLRRRAQAATPRTEDPEVVYAALRDLAAGCVAGATPAWCGVGCGGPMSAGGETVSPLNIPAWRGFPLRSRLARDLALPVVVDNDAKALALAEGWLGAAAGCRNYLAMVVSTGVGGGLVVDGRLLDGASGNAGHIGHVVVVPDGAACPCGGRGCLEAEISGASIARRIGRPAAGAGPAERDRAGRLLGRALADAAALLDLELVAVGGSVALGFGAPFLAAARAAFAEESRLGFTAATRIELAGLTDRAPLVGAAALAWRTARV